MVTPNLFRLLLSLLLCFALIPFPAPALAQSLDFAAIEAHLQDLMEMYRVPGVGIALVQHGEVIYAGGLGVRSTETQEPVTADTLFAIGSITKSFTALGVMLLVEEGRLDLDTPIITYVPDFKLSDADATRTVTLRHVLSHTSGLPRADEWVFETPLTRRELIEAMAEIKLTTRPGSLFQYNNQNFALAGYVIEVVTGQSWEQFTRQRILEPLGMETTNFSVDETQQAPDYALPHTLNVLEGMQPIPFYAGLAPIGPAGSINASARELAQYALFQMGDGTFGDRAILSRQSLDEMHREQVAISRREAGQEASPEALVTDVGYGLAWISETFRGVQLVEHGGAINGFTASLTLVPAEKAGIVLLNNADSGGLFNEAARLWLAEQLLGLESERDIAAVLNKAAQYDPVKFNERLEAARAYQADPADFELLLGDYSSPVGTLTVSLRAGKLYLTQRVGSTALDIELVPFDIYRFLANYQGIAGQEFRFEIDNQGTVTLYQEGIRAGQKLGEGVTELEFTGPEERFSFTVPAGLAPTVLGELVVVNSTDPEGTFAIQAIEAEEDDLRANLERWFRMYNPTFDEEPVNVRAVPLPDGTTWTQYIYMLPSEQFSVAVATRQAGRVYIVALTATGPNIQALTPAFNQILLTFKFGE